MPSTYQTKLEVFVAKKKHCLNQMLHCANDAKFNRYCKRLKRVNERLAALEAEIDRRKDKMKNAA